jgi:hypothetical protein
MPRAIHSLRTWQCELVVVAAALSAVTLVTGGHLADWIATLAVTLTFAHAQVADRLAEREAARARPAVECHAVASRYFVAKELLWCGVFALHRSWPALVGVGLFLAYPAWRRWWRARHPLSAVAE